MLWNRVCKTKGVKLVIGLARRNQLLPNSNKKRVDKVLQKQLEKCKSLNVLKMRTRGVDMTDQIHYTEQFLERTLLDVLQLASPKNN